MSTKAQETQAAPVPFTAEDYEVCIGLVNLGLKTEGINALNVLVPLLQKIQPLLEAERAKIQAD